MGSSSNIYAISDGECESVRLLQYLLPADTGMISLIYFYSGKFNTEALERLRTTSGNIPPHKKKKKKKKKKNKKQQRQKLKLKIPDSCFIQKMNSKNL
jgi:hypothetical protein